MLVDNALRLSPMGGDGMVRGSNAPVCMEADMIHWYKKLYMDETVRKHPKRCMAQVEQCYGNAGRGVSRFLKGYYVIALPSNGDNLLDIMGTRQLFFRHYARLDLYVVGLVASYEAALELLPGILLEQDGDQGDAPFRSRLFFDKAGYS